jgi:hypothetical protein
MLIYYEFIIIINLGHIIDFYYILINTITRFINLKFTSRIYCEKLLRKFIKIF